MSDDFTEAMQSYRQAFGEYFPTACVQMSDDEMTRTMRECVERGELYEVDGYEDAGDGIYYVLDI